MEGMTTITQHNGAVTEQDIFLENIPLITELIMETRGMTAGQYGEFRQECITENGKTYPTAVSFIQKVLLIVDAFFQGGCMEPGEITDRLKDMCKIA